MKGQEEEYMYTSITSLTSTKPLDEARSGENNPDLNELPERCIIEKKIPKLKRDDHNENNNEDDIKNKDVKAADLYDFKYYINSEEFFKHFADIFSKEYDKLGFSKQAKDSSLSQSSIIYINKEDKNENNKKSITLWEVYPAISTPWPGIAAEWCLRERTKHPPREGEPPIQWPAEPLVRDIQTNKAAVLPVGYIQKRGANEDFAKEWCIAFPYAERTLQTWFNHSQMRCYLFVLLLYKTFIEQPNPKLGLSPHHIRTIIFWECERNWKNWQEENLGAKVLYILDKLYESLSKGRMFDYFVKDRNLLENTPKKYLNESRVRLNRIRENPFFHILLAIRNLRYTEHNTFPILDLNELMEIITCENALARRMAPNINLGIGGNARRLAAEERELDESQIWARRKRQQVKNEKKRKEEERRKKEKKNERKISVEEINVDVSIFM